MHCKYLYHHDVTADLFNVSSLRSVLFIHGESQIIRNSRKTNVLFFLGPQKISESLGALPSPTSEACDEVKGVHDADHVSDDVGGSHGGVRVEACAKELHLHTQTYFQLLTNHYSNHESRGLPVR